MTSDPHAPTPAGPDPDQPTVDEPTVVAPAADASTEDDWLRPDPEVAGAPAPDPILSTPSAFTPPGTPEPDDGPAATAQAKAQELTDKAQELKGKAQEVTAEKPEVLVGLAFVGGAAFSLLLKRFGR